MSFLGNLFHSIANVVDGNNDDKKKKQQSQPQVITPTKKATVLNTASTPAVLTTTPSLGSVPLQKVVPKAAPKPVAPAVAPPTTTPAPAPAVNRLGGSDALAPLVKIGKPNPIGPDAPVGNINWKDEAEANALGVAHVATGIPEGAASLFDMLTPGKGSNRVTQALQKVDKTITGKGQAAAVRSGDPESFNALQPAANVASLIAPGDLVKVAKGLPAVAETADKASNAFFNGIPILRKAVQDGHVTPEAAEAQTQVADGVHTVNPTRPQDAADQVVAQGGTPPAATPEVAAPAATPAAVVDDASAIPAQAAPVDPAIPAPAEPAPVEPAPAPKVVAPTAPNAPGVRKAALKRLGDLGASVDADATTHDVLSNQDLLQAGRDHAATFNDAGLVNQYKNGFNPHGAADLAQGHAALERLNEIAKTSKGQNVSKAIDNIIEGSEKEFSGGGRTVNYAQQFYDGLKGPAKTSYLIRQIDKVREKAGLSLLRDNVDDKAAAEDQINKFVNNEETIKGKVATAESRLAEIQDAARSGDGNKQLTKEANTLNGTIKSHQLELTKNTTDLAKYYDSVAPQTVKGGTKLGDLGRTLMLSSVGGRINDVATTGINSAHQLLQQSIEATGGKALNKIKGTPGANISTLPSPAAVARGVKFGLKKSKQRFAGNITDGDAISLLKKADTGSGKGQLLSRGDGTLASKITAPLHRIIRPATEIATDLSEGIKEARVQQLASQQGKKLGLVGDDLKTYTAATTAAPSRKMLEAGDQLQAEVNNMHDNPITDALTSVSSGLSKVPYVGEQIRNLTIPFTRWTGGQLHNALIDKNALVNTGRMVKAIAKGDTQGAITEASKLAVNGVGAIGAGYALAKAGLLTTQNAQGYNDDGVYLHIGGRYIPATFLGFFAPGMILGSSVHDAMKDGKKNILSTAVDATGKVALAGYKAFGGDSLTGESNPVLTALSDAKRTGYGAVAETAGGQAVGQYIPAIGGDINAGLNNGVGIPLTKIKTPSFDNPTHEAALTKATKLNPKTGNQVKDIPKSIENQLLNKVPVASQHLPRNEGVAAPDELDRITRGDRDTQTEVQAKADAKKQADTSADLLKRGVPDPSATYDKGDSFKQAVENRIENGKYDQAIEGLQANLDKVKSGKDVTTTETDPIEKQLATVKVLKAGNYDPGVRDDYTNTTLTEWRDMGDPTSDSYDPAQYKLLYNYDKDLSASGASSTKGDGSVPKYSIKDTSKSDAKKGSAAAKKAITSNTLGSTPDFSLPDISITPKKITAAAAQIPTIQEIQPGQLIKKRAISVGR